METPKLSVELSGAYADSSRFRPRCTPLQRGGLRFARCRIRSQKSPVFCQCWQFSELAENLFLVLGGRPVKSLHLPYTAEYPPQMCRNGPRLTNLSRSPKFRERPQEVSSNGLSHRKIGTFCLIALPIYRMTNSGAGSLSGRIPIILLAPVETRAIL